MRINNANATASQIKKVLWVMRSHPSLKNGAATGGVAIDVATNGTFDDAVVIGDPISINVELACGPAGLTGLLFAENERGIEGWLLKTLVGPGGEVGTVGVLKTNPNEISGSKRMPTGNSKSEVTAICQMENRVAAELLGINGTTTAAMVRSKVLPMRNTISTCLLYTSPSPRD